jgi:hypothetical protein
MARNRHYSMLQVVWRRLPEERGRTRVGETIRSSLRWSGLDHVALSTVWVGARWNGIGRRFLRMAHVVSRRLPEEQG